MSIDHSLVMNWANEKGVEVQWPDTYRRAGPDDDFASRYDFQTSPCVDFGKFIEKVPWALFRPRSEEELIASVSFLGREKIPFKVRGTGHSSGGQALTEEGAVLDLSGVSGVVSDDPDGQRVTVYSGTEWMDLIRYLRSQNRHPLVLTDNWWASVGGTITVGGFGDASQHYGMQADTVETLRIITLDGELHEVGPGDELFDYSLAGRSQLGVISGATLRTRSAPWILHLRSLKWKNFEDFLADVDELNQQGAYEFLRPRVRWTPEMAVHAAAGYFSERPVDDRRFSSKMRARLGRWQAMDFYEHASLKPLHRWERYSPSVEFLLPVPSAIDTFVEIHGRVMASGLPEFLIEGNSIKLLRRTTRLPLAPFPPGPNALLVAIRPELTYERLPDFMGLLFELSELAMAAGGRMYLMSIQPDRKGWLAQQFGDELPILRRLKSKYDPNRLLDGGLL